MKNSGFSLIELVISITIVAILIGIALPSFNRQIKSAHAASTSASLLETFHTARSIAVSKNKRVTVKPTPNWSSGWQMFIDDNSDGALSEGETLLNQTSSVSGIFIEGTTAVNRYVSYVGSGASETMGGGFLAGTFQVCATDAETDGMAIVIRRGGRIRTEKISAADCAAR
jgi:type IV fimbrial biogenesis protein FimT